MNPAWTLRPDRPREAYALVQSGVHPLLAQLLAARGVKDPTELDAGLERLHPPASLKGVDAAGQLLSEAIDQRWRVVVVADYDCDGATACAVAMRGLVMLGARREDVGYVVPDRRVHGYGLTPAIVELALAQGAQVLVTVDNGIASLEGVAHAIGLGLRVLITDHHLPARDANGAVVLPPADVIVNPNQPDDTFASKALAGVGVMFYVLLTLRARMREAGRFTAQSQPRLDSLLDLVALGTVADVAMLDANNRRLVAQGLRRIRAGRMQPGVAALFAVAGRDPSRAQAADFGFALGPRINAAGRLSDMTLGIECLCTDDSQRAQALATELDAINRQRRELESDMRDQAEHILQRFADDRAASAAVCLFDPIFHEGIVGIVAGRLKDRLHRPTFVFARGQDGNLKGSGRSIPGFHLRDALDLVSKRAAGVLLRFGGHAMAAGATVREGGFHDFDAALREVAQEWLHPLALQRTVCTDGALPAQWFNAQTAELLDEQVWGQGFEAPLFCEPVQVVQQTLVKERHLRLRLRVGEQEREAIWFQRTEPVAGQVHLAYRMRADEWNGKMRVQMVIEAAFDQVTRPNQ